MAVKKTVNKWLKYEALRYKSSKIVLISLLSQEIVQNYCDIIKKNIFLPKRNAMDKLGKKHANFL